MKKGQIVEFIDNTNIVLALILDLKNQRLKLLTQFNNKIDIHTNRIIHDSDILIDLSANNQTGSQTDNQILIKTLIDIAEQRERLANSVDVKKIWDQLHLTPQWIELPEMTKLCFGSVTKEYESAAIRAMFKNRLYFKFYSNKFLPNSVQKTEEKSVEINLIARKEKLIQYGVKWLKNALNMTNHNKDIMTEGEENQEIINIFQSFYLLEKKSADYEIVKTIFRHLEIEDKETIFNVFIKLGIWDEDINIDIFKYNIPASFSGQAEKEANLLEIYHTEIRDEGNRKNLTTLRVITIDGAVTHDFDDAISIEELTDEYILGIHISDVGHYVKKNDPIDIEARKRASSIYMPNNRIPMLPLPLSENICSLKENKTSYAISTMIRLDKNFNVKEYEVCPSIIKVEKRMTYNDVNLLINIDKSINSLYQIGKAFRRKRFQNNAVHINLPEINISVNQKKEISINKIDRESPSRMFVAEIMIMANSVMAQYLRNNNTPAVFRGQNSPNKRLYTGETDNLFQNWSQRRYLSPLILNHNPFHHSGLGLEAYTTATSPIRKYFDLAAQRQIRSLFGYEDPYASEEIDSIIENLAEPMHNAAMLQQAQTNYWLFKHLETKIGEKEKAIVLFQNDNNYLILLTEYMFVTAIPLSRSYSLKPEETITVTISYINARKNVFNCALGL